MTLVGLFGLTSHLRAQAAGEFITPSFRSASTRFTYWDSFSLGNAQGFNYQINNPPALGGGLDNLGNPTNYGVGATASKVSFVQTGTPTAFITSSGAIYSFSNPTAFVANYAQDEAEPAVTNVIFQTQTGGTRMDLNNISLKYAPPGGGPVVSLPAQFKALDEPRTGAFSERLVAAFQWNLTGLEVRNFSIQFSSPSSSMPLWQAQLDVVQGSAFVQALGFLLEDSSLPLVRFGSPGHLEANLDGAENRFFLPGTTVHLTGEASAGFSHVGWLRNGVISEALQYDLTFGVTDEKITGIYCPLSYAAWRNHFFSHANTLTQTGPDNITESVSGMAADPDQDGAVNLLEFAFGGDPYTPDAALLAPQCGVVEVGSDRFPSITYHRRAADPAEMELLYEVQVSTDLVEWTSNFDIPGTTTELTTTTLNSQGMKTVTAIGATPLAANQKQYLRLKISTP